MKSGAGRWEVTPALMKYRLMRRLMIPIENDCDRKRWKYRFSSFKALPVIHVIHSNNYLNSIPRGRVEVGATDRRLGPVPILVRESKERRNGDLVLAMREADCGDHRRRWSRYYRKSFHRWEGLALGRCFELFLGCICAPIACAVLLEL